MGCLCARPRDKEVPSHESPADRSRAHHKSHHKSRKSHSSDTEKPKVEMGTIRQITTSIMTMFTIESIEIAEDNETVNVVKYKNASEVCILRTFHKPQSEKLPEAREKFAEEGGLLSRLDHPHVARIYGLLEDLNSFGVVSEYPRGGKLLDKLMRLPQVSDAMVARLMSQVLEALSYCHAKKLYHLDLKLSDLFLIKNNLSPEECHVKVTGWEKGRSFAPSTLSKVSPSPFNAPEVLVKLGCDKSDIWSCGICLYIIFCGTSPFTSASYAESLAGAPPPVISYKKINEKASLVALLQSMLAWDAASRPTAVQCLKHPGLTMHTNTPVTPSKSPVSTSLSTLSATRTCSALKKAIKFFIIDNAPDQSQVAKLAKEFKDMDENGDGQLSLEELTKGLSQVMKPQDAKAEAKRIMHLADQNGNGLMDYSEFLTSSYNEKLLLTHENIKAVFLLLDVNGSGSLRVEELSPIFIHMKEKEKKKMLRDLSKIVNQIGVSALTLREFTELVLKLST